MMTLSIASLLNEKRALITAILSVERSSLVSAVASQCVNMWGNGGHLRGKRVSEERKEGGGTSFFRSFVRLERLIATAHVIKV